MKKNSTGSLTKEQKKVQDDIYAKDNKYDYVIVGTGLAALSVGSLLAQAGKRVCMLEAHDTAGGYAHTFKMGDYSFCAQIHYTWKCNPGGKVYEFLKKLGLEKEVTFELFDKDGYDHMVMPDGKRVKIPYGYDMLAQNIEAAYPGQGKNVEKFCKILTKIDKEVGMLPEQKIKPWEYLTKGWKFLTLLKYKSKTLQDVFDDCNLSQQAQAVLIAQAGDFMLPPNELSIFAYVGLFGGYNTGAFYPTKHFSEFTGKVVELITKNEGCHIYYETQVNKINVVGDFVVSVETKDCKTFTADKFICNMDPQAASYLIGRDKFPKSYLKKLSYDYGDSGLMVYLGLKDIDLKKYGFGKYNIWHMEQWDMNKIWGEQKNMDFSKPWIFMATPTMHTSQKGTAPPGGSILQIETFCPYAPLKEAANKSYRDYNRLKQEVANRMLEIVEEKYIPNLKDHIVVKVVGTPTTNEDFCLAPKGNAYGAPLTPKNMALNRVKAGTPWKNFFWCNATSGYPGFYGTIGTGMKLYMDLTGDEFYDKFKSPTTEEFIARIREQD